MQMILKHIFFDQHLEPEKIKPLKIRVELEVMSIFCCFSYNVSAKFHLWLS